MFVGGSPRVARWVAATGCLLVGLGACGGGGGGGGSGTTTQGFNTAEFQFNYGLGNINALAVYGGGFSGAGQTIAIIDTGIDVDHPDLIANIAAASTDIVSGDPTFLNDVDGHGTQVAGVAAAARNGFGGHGVAFNAQILAIRADAAAICIDTSCGFDDADLAAAVDFAVAQGADVINMSLAARRRAAPDCRRRYRTRSRPASSSPSPPATKLASIRSTRRRSPPTRPSTARSSRSARSIRTTSSPISATGRAPRRTSSSWRRASPSSPPPSAGIRVRQRHLVRGPPRRRRHRPAARALSQPDGTERGQHSPDDGDRSRRGGHRRDVRPRSPQSRGGVGAAGHAHAVARRRERRWRRRGWRARAKPVARRHGP